MYLVIIYISSHELECLKSCVPFPTLCSALFSIPGIIDIIRAYLLVSVQQPVACYLQSSDAFYPCAPFFHLFPCSPKPDGDS